MLQIPDNPSHFYESKPRSKIGKDGIISSYNPISNLEPTSIYMSDTKSLSTCMTLVPWRYCGRRPSPNCCTKSITRCCVLPTQCAPTSTCLSANINQLPTEGGEDLLLNLCNRRLVLLTVFIQLANTAADIEISDELSQDSLF